MIVGQTGSYQQVTPTNWELTERIRKMSFTQLLDYRDDLKNPRLSYADGRNKQNELWNVEQEINKRVK